MDQNNGNKIDFTLSQIVDQNNDNEINFTMSQIVDQNNDNRTNSIRFVESTYLFILFFILFIFSLHLFCTQLCNKLNKSLKEI